MTFEQSGGWGANLPCSRKFTYNYSLPSTCRFPAIELNLEEHEFELCGSVKLCWSIENISHISEPT